eukprot:s3241_g11.t1
MGCWKAPPRLRHRRHRARRASGSGTQPLVGSFAPTPLVCTGVCGALVCRALINERGAWIQGRRHGAEHCLHKSQVMILLGIPVAQKCTMAILVGTRVAKSLAKHSNPSPFWGAASGHAIEAV